MKHTIFVRGVVVFVLAVWLSSANAQKEDENIVFAPKNFADSAQIGLDGSVTISGTLTGEGLSYRNNTYSIACDRGRKECLVSSVHQIGQNQIGRLDSPESYPVKKWSPFEVVATEETSDRSCTRVTITISRKSETALWVQEPINQTLPACLKSETKTYKWTIEDSLGWKKMKGK